LRRRDCLGTRSSFFGRELGLESPLHPRVDNIEPKPNRPGKYSEPDRAHVTVQGQADSN